MYKDECDEEGESWKRSSLYFNLLLSSGLNFRNGKVYSVVAVVERTVELFAMSQKVCIPAFIAISTLIEVSSR